MQSSKVNLLTPPHILIYLCIAALWLNGCAKEMMYTSQPSIQKAENDVFIAQLRPDKEGGNSYIVFQLTVINKTQELMAIDWNQSRYVHNGRMGGVFLFEGVQPGFVKNHTTMMDVIPGKSAFQKIIAPADLIAYTPIKYQNQLAQDEEPISAGPLPTGENGIHLVVKFQRIEVTETLTVKIEQTEIN